MAARSDAEIPVVVPCLKSVDTVNAVPFGSWLLTYIGGSCRASSRSPGTCSARTQDQPRRGKRSGCRMAGHVLSSKSPRTSSGL